MVVAELIERLQRFPFNAEIVPDGSEESLAVKFTSGGRIWRMSVFTRDAELPEELRKGWERDR